MIQPGNDLIRREDVDAGGRQFDGQGQAIQPSADRGDGRRVRVVQREVRAGRAGSLDEQLRRPRWTRSSWAVGTPGSAGSSSGCT